ncbi:MFS transporter [Streptomyces antnestii]|uniref:MFS transporter n=1 Tax=Streptomyces antnestii TaxID=2494256 RepID=A0A3S2V8J2_9ACTN|nr:MFS transporter [Streptomyces sp. San01]
MPRRPSLRLRHPLLGNTSFRRFFLGRLLSLVGDAVIPSALALAVLAATGGSASALALVLGCAMVPRLVLLPLGGVIADRFNPRTVALTTDLVRCAGQLFVAFELLSGKPELWHIAAAEAIGGAASAFAMPTLAPLIVGIVGEQDRQAANSTLGVVRSATLAGGPALAGLLVLTAGPGWAFVLDSASFAVSAALLATLRLHRVPAAAEDRRSLRSDLVEGWHEVRSRGWYWTSLVAHATWNGAAAVFATLGPAIAVKELGGNGAWIVIAQAGAVGLLLGSLLSGRARPRRPVLTGNLALTTYVLPLGLLALYAPAPAVAAASGVALAGLGFFNPLWETAVQAAVPKAVLARVTSYDWLLSLAAMPLGYVLAPLAADAWGEATPLWIAAAAVAVTCAGTAFVPGVRAFTHQAGTGGGEDAAGVRPASTPARRP